MEIQTIKDIPLVDIEIPEVQMRKVDKTSTEYIGLVRDIGKRGLLSNIIVREISSGKYEVVAGFHRINACLDNGHVTIACKIEVLGSEGEVRITQMAENLHKKIARPVEFANSLKRIMADPPYMDMSLEEICAELNIPQTPMWVRTQLSLTKLVPELQELTDAGHINLSKASMLGTLPVDEQMNYKEAAIGDTIGTNEFRSQVQARKEELKAIRKGEPIKRDRFSGSTIRKVSEFKTIISDIENNNQSPFETPIQALLWAIGMDPTSVDKRNQKKDMQKSERDDMVKGRREALKLVKEMSNDELVKLLEDQAAG